MIRTTCESARRSFNEAAGFTQRKRCTPPVTADTISGFNEAAGFTQRKLILAALPLLCPHLASMRPPVLPSGNSATASLVSVGAMARLQ